MAANPETKEFLLKIIDVLLDYVRTQNDRNERVLEFHHPEEMKRLLDLELPDTAVPLQQLVQDCATTLKYQVRTGKNSEITNIELELQCICENWTKRCGWMNVTLIRSRMFAVCCSTRSCWIKKSSYVTTIAWWEHAYDLLQSKTRICGLTQKM